jgi:tryptophan 2-C-methyltransferase
MDATILQWQLRTWQRRIAGVPRGRMQSSKDGSEEHLAGHSPAFRARGECLAPTSLGSALGMLILVNLNRLEPPVAPVGVDYIASAAEAAGIPTEVIDLGLRRADWVDALAPLSTMAPRLIGLSLRNVDDCFWPSATSYLPQYVEIVRCVRQLTSAPIVVGGVGFSIFGRELLELIGADFGVRGDGELALVELYRALHLSEQLPRVPGLIWSKGQNWQVNEPAFLPTAEFTRTRRHVRNDEYFRQGGQIGIETKRGCPRKCIYCADPIAKGVHVRCRSPQLVVEEFDALLRQGIDVFHICDGEFNVPRSHALAVCEALVRSRISERIRFYAYLAVRPFDLELARAMKRAGCVGINFTGDSGSDQMLFKYRAAHRRSHLADAVGFCRVAGITCMVDLLLGGPGETLETLRETIEFAKRINPDCVGAGLGLRLYPTTPAAAMLSADGTMQSGAGIRRRYTGPINLLWPTFFISPALGLRPAEVVRELIAGDERFFPPAEEQMRGDEPNGHNYSDNQSLSSAIAGGARGAYWDILRKLRATS